MWLILLLIINCAVGRTIHYDSALGYECDTNENCVGLVPNSMCFDHKCICQLGYKSDGIFRCIYGLRYRRQMSFGRRKLKFIFS
jgi:hypothetical protein